MFPLALAPLSSSEGSALSLGAWCCLINLEGKGHKPGAATMNLLPWHGVLASMSEVTVPQGTWPDPDQKGRAAWARLAHVAAGTAWFSPVSKPD